MTSLRIKLAVLLALCSIGVFASTASADSGSSNSVNAAFVVNHGQQPGDNCSVTFINGATYNGYITHLVSTSSGMFNLGCLIFGLPMNTTFVGSGDNKVQVNNAGIGLLSFNGV